MGLKQRFVDGSKLLAFQGIQRHCPHPCATRSVGSGESVRFLKSGLSAPFWLFLAFQVSLFFGQILVSPHLAYATFGTSTTNLSPTSIERPSTEVDFAGLLSPSAVGTVGTSSAKTPGAVPVVTQNALDASTPVAFVGRDEYGSTLHAGRTDVTGSPFLPGYGSSIPPTLWDLTVGGTYIHRFSNRDTFGADLVVGSQSDRPFATINEDSMRADVAYSWRASDFNTWRFSLNYSNNRPFLNGIPIPGITFKHENGSRFGVTLGVPFVSAWARFLGRGMINGSLTPASALAQVSYSLHGDTRLYTSYIWDNDTFFLANRTILRQRFFLYDQRLALGLVQPVNHQLALDISAGREFGQTALLTGKDAVSNARNPQVYFDPQYFVMLKAKVKLQRDDL